MRRVCSSGAVPSSDGARGGEWKWRRVSAVYHQCEPSGQVAEEAAQLIYANEGVGL